MIHEDYAQHCFDVWKLLHGLVIVTIVVLGFA
jgi:hypothetical protein